MKLPRSLETGDDIPQPTAISVYRVRTSHNHLQSRVIGESGSESGANKITNKQTKETNERMNEGTNE